MGVRKSLNGMPKGATTAACLKLVMPLIELGRIHPYRNKVS